MLIGLIVLRTLVVAAAVLAVHRRVRRDPVDRPTWRAYRSGLTILAACSVFETVLLVTGTPVGTAGLVAVLPLRLVSSVGVYLLYHGMALWFRSRETGRPVGRVDWLVGLGCVCGFAGVVNLVVDVPGGLLESLTPQLRLLHLSTIVVLCVAVGWAALSIPRPLRHRTCSLTLGVGALAVTQTAYVAFGPSTTLVVVAWCGWIAMASVYGVVALLPPAETTRSVRSRMTVPVTGSIGLLLGLVALVGAGSGAVSDRGALVWGALAVAASGVRLVRLIRDLADHDRARRLASTDDLTGLANRREFLLRLAEACRSGRTVGVLLLDLDGFKEVNDRYGHAAGDELLADTADRLLQVTPPGASLARLGGDEFALVMPGFHSTKITATAHAVVDAVRERPATGAGPSAGVRVGASVGIAVSTGSDDVGAQELLRRADSAMYAAKGTGGGVALHDDAAHRAWRDRLALSDELHDALGPDAPPAAADAFTVHYQPQVSLTDDRVVGVEALVRWNHPRRGLLAPGQFLDVLEERGLMPALTLHVARSASAEVAGWRAAGTDLRLSINVSGSYLSDPDLLDLLAEVVTAGEAAQFVVEVTETTLMNDPDRALASCIEITGHGCGLSIDDFGTGYSSLAYLANLPATELKIDRSFTARLLEDERTAAIVAGTVELAHHLGLRTVGEGVEDEATLELLRSLGCDESQGYLHGRPLPGPEFLDWLRRREPALNRENATPIGR